MEQYNSIQQLLKKEGGKKNPVFPPTVVQAVFDAKTGASLEAILAQFNSVYLQYQGSPKATRLIIPKEMRRAGLTITYMNMEGETITERASSAVQKDNDNWGLDINWSRVDELALSGDISVSAKGTWIINGYDTGVKAVGPKGDAGLTPWLKTIDNRLHLSYDNVTWEPCSDPIAAYFRWSSNKIQISRDNKTWTDLSGTFADNVHIKGYVATTSALPSGAAQGDIYGVGPTYAAEDTAHTNPIYRLYVRNANTWVDNGSFTSIAAGIVQEPGDSENAVMSQKAVTEKLSELGSEVNTLYSETVGKEFVGTFTVAWEKKSLGFTIKAGSIVENVGNIDLMLFNSADSSENENLLVGYGSKVLPFDSNIVGIRENYGEGRFVVKSAIEKIQTDVANNNKNIASVNSNVEALKMQTIGKEVSETFTREYEVVSLGFTIKAGSVVENIGEIDLMLRNSSNSSENINLLVGYGSKVLTFDVVEVQARDKIGIGKFVVKGLFQEQQKNIELMLEGIAKNSEGVAKNSKDIAKNSEGIERLNKSVESIIDIKQNIYNGSIVGGYIGSDGVLSGSEPYLSSGLIPVDGNTFYYINRPSISGKSRTNMRVLAADKVTELKAKIAATGDVADGFYQYNEDGTAQSFSSQILIPDNGAYIQFTIWFNSTAPTDTELSVVNKIMIEKVGNEYNPNFKPSAYLEPNNIETSIKDDALNNSDVIKDLKKGTNGKDLKILFIGNSFLDASINYAPFIFYNLTPKQDVTFVELVRGGSSLSTWYDILSGNDTTSSLTCHIFKMGQNAWDNRYYIEGNNNKEKAETVIKMFDYDAIVLQQVSGTVDDYDTYQPYLNNIIKMIFNLINKPVKLGWLLTPTKNTILEESKTSFENVLKSVERVMNETAIEFVIPCGTAFQNARTTSLQSLGTDGNFIQQQHPQAGLPCQILAYSLILSIYDLLGINKVSIYGETTRVNVEWSENKGLHDLQGYPDNPIKVTDEYARIAQICAMIANKNPLTITDCQGL